AVRGRSGGDRPGVRWSRSRLLDPAIPLDHSRVGSGTDGNSPTTAGTSTSMVGDTSGMRSASAPSSSLARISRAATTEPGFAGSTITVALCMPSGAFNGTGTVAPGGSSTSSSLTTPPLVSSVRTVTRELVSITELTNRVLVYPDVARLSNAVAGPCSGSESAV